MPSLNPQPLPPQPRATPKPPKFCPHCGTAITARPRFNRCPHCRMAFDAPVLLRLEHADVAWLRQISWGALALAGGAGLHLLAAYQAVVGQDAVRGSALQVFAAALDLAGLWFLTTPENPRRKMTFVPLAARWFGGAAVLLWLGAAIMASRQTSPQMLTAAALSALAVAAVALGRYSVPLAQRVPHPGLANQLRGLTLLLPLALTLLIACQFIQLAAFEALFFVWYPFVGGLAGVICWVAATMIRLFVQLRQSATAADLALQKHFQAVQAAARAAAQANPTMPD